MNDTSSQTPSSTILDDVDFLYEIGTLRHISRAWRQFGGLPFANVAEHTFRMTMIAMLVALKEGANVERAVQLALVHDVLESRTGDANYVQKMFRNDDVEGAWGQIEGTCTISTHINELRRELSAADTLEAKIVKDADKLDCDLELREMQDLGAGIAQALKCTREAVSKTFYTGTARHLYAEIRHRSSHEWHLKARNRLNSGDWGGKET